MGEGYIKEVETVRKVVWERSRDFNCMIFNICMGIAR
jgi:hypothetical protein